MKIIAASTNPTKIMAAKEIFKEYCHNSYGTLTFNGVYEFNRSLIWPEQMDDPFYQREALVSLVIKQAKEAFNEHDYMVPNSANSIKEKFNFSVATKEGLVTRYIGAVSRYFLVECGVIYDEKGLVGIGFGQEFEVPMGVVDKIKYLKTINSVKHPFPKANIETVVHEKINEPNSDLKYGLVGLISGGTIMRKDYIKQALQSAMLPLLSNRLYKDDEEWKIK